MTMRFSIKDPKTKEIVFENVFPSCDSGTLEQLKEISSKRKLVAESINKTNPLTEAVAREMTRGLTSPCQQDLHKLEQYLPLLANLVYYIDKVDCLKARWVSSLKIRWSSLLVSPSLFHLRGPKFFQVDNMLFELGMVLFLYAAKLREKATEIMFTDMLQSGTFFREAAGVFRHLADEVLPALQPSLPAEKPLEVNPCVCSALSLLCLAEGQAVTVKKAEEMGTSASLLSKLHFGVKELVTEANASLFSGMSHESKEISSRFLEYISSLGALHELKCERYLAEAAKSEGQLGAAIGILRRALAGARKITPGEESWRSEFKRETEEVSRRVKKYERENEFVLRQKVPLEDELPLPQGNKIVNLIPYSPTKWETELSFKF